MCNACSSNSPIVKVTITDKNQVATFCHNCLAVKVINKEVNFENNYKFICDVTKKPGAVKYESADETYILSSDILERLILHSLTKDEYFALIEKYGENSYMLHDDFYDPSTGEAMQPF